MSTTIFRIKLGRGAGFKILLSKKPVAKSEALLLAEEKQPARYKGLWPVDRPPDEIAIAVFPEPSEGGGGTEPIEGRPVLTLNYIHYFGTMTILPTGEYADGFHEARYLIEVTGARVSVHRGPGGDKRHSQRSIDGGWSPPYSDSGDVNLSFPPTDPFFDLLRLVPNEGDDGSESIEHFRVQEGNTILGHGFFYGNYLTVDLVYPAPFYIPYFDPPRSSFSNLDDIT